MAYDSSPEKPSFDRERPLYRAFLSDDDNSIAWHHVSVDFTPGDELTDSEVSSLAFIYSQQPWWPQFEARLKLNRKATIYASLDRYGPVPADLSLEIDGELDRVTIFKIGNYPVANGILVSEDRKGRFRRGEFVRTSYILAGPDENGIIRTRNSVYRLLNWNKSE